MDPFITLRTFHDPTEAQILKGKLEAEGIECNLEGVAVQSLSPLYTGGLGTIKLLVRESDKEEALEIIGTQTFKDYYEDKDVLYAGDAMEHKLRTALSNKNRNKKTLWFFAVLALIIFVAAYYSSRVPISKQLAGSWNIEILIFNAQNVTPNTLNPTLSAYPCGTEKIDFYEDGTCIFPGINTEAIQGKWSVDGKVMRCMADTLKDVFEGNFKFKLSENNSLSLESANTTIICRKCAGYNL